jgi:hypothetical protein
MAAVPIIAGDMTMTTAAPAWTCPTCSVEVTTPHCPTCGEQPLRRKDLTLRGLVLQLVSEFSSVDSRLIRSLRTLVGRPGALTSAYVQGRRKSYVGPVALFFAVNAVFFVTQSVTNVNIFSTSLESHLHEQDWSPLAQSLVASRLASTQRSLEQLAPLFNQAVVLNAKSLIILMVLAFATLLPITFRRSDHPAVAHVAFSLHVYAFLLLLFCALSGVAAIDVLVGGSGLRSPRMDNALTAVNLTACATYVYLAIGEFYRARGPLRVVKALVLTLAVAAIALGYRFALFLMTLYSL